MNTQANSKMNRNTSKKAQLSLFIIIGLVIVLAVGLTIYLSGKEERQTTAEQTFLGPAGARPVEEYIGNCLTQSVAEGMKLVAAQGGYLEPQNAAQLGDVRIAYGFVVNESTIPTIEVVAQQAATYVAAALADCANLDSFREQGFTINTTTPPTINLRFTSAKTLATASWQLRLTRADTTTILDRFVVDIPSSILPAHTAARKATFDLVRDSEQLPVTDWSTATITAGMQPTDTSTLIIWFDDSANTLFNEPLRFAIAASFVLNRAPSITELPDEIVLRRGELFLYDVNATDPEGEQEGAGLVFTDDTSLFDILQDGVIIVTPRVPGTYNVTITATDSKGLSDKRTTRFVVD